MSTPAVSVLMPVRNAAATLPAAVASICRQSLGDFEVIAIDDGSTDSSRPILEDWARSDQRVKLVPSQGRGLVAALETGRRHVRAPLIARMDADDVSHPERLRLQVRHLRGKPRLAGTGCLVRLFPRGQMRQGWKRYERWVNSLATAGQIHRERFVESPLVHPSVVLRTEVLGEIGGYRDEGWPEDYDLWLRLMSAGRILDKVPRTLLFWRVSPQRHSLQHPRYQPERFMALKLAHLRTDLLKDVSSVALWGAGKNGRRWARLLGDGGFRVECFIDVDPVKIGRQIAGVPVFGPERATDPELPFVLGAVAAAGARSLIRDALLRAGKEEERDFIFVQ
jgi:glycosyltransferase involved in cell wall biosynthesis